METLFDQVLSFCRAPNSVALASTLLDSLKLRESLNNMKKAAEKEFALAPESTRLPDHGILLCHIGTLGDELNLYHPRFSTENVTSFNIDRLSEENQSKYIHWREREVFLDSKFFMTNCEARPGDQIYWISLTPHAFVYRLSPVEGSPSAKPLERIGRGVLANEDGSHTWRRYSSIDFLSPPGRIPEAYEDVAVYNVGKWDLLKLLEEEKALRKCDFEEEGRKVKLDAARRHWSPSELSDVLTDTGKAIQDLNDLCRDAQTIRIIDELLAETDGRP